MKAFLRKLQLAELTRGETGELTRELPLGALVIPQHMELIGSGEGAGVGLGNDGPFGDGWPNL